MTERIKQLVEQLNRAAKAYYQEDREILSNQEYDALYDELAALEQKTGTILANSPHAEGWLYGAEQSGEGGARKPDSFLG